MLNINVPYRKMTPEQKREYEKLRYYKNKEHIREIRKRAYARKKELEQGLGTHQDV